MMWNKYDDKKPSNSGDKVVFILDGGCCSISAMLVDAGPCGEVEILDAEDSMVVDDKWLIGSIWAKLPDDYPIAFTQASQDDWY